MAFIKNVSSRTEEQIRREVELQRRAAKKGLAPKVIDTDYKTFIKMEKIFAPCIADNYGEEFRNAPKQLVKDIYNILRKLYYDCDIEYIDVTPYNFIEDLEGRLWVIDFGDAISVKRNWFLEEAFDNGFLTGWNPDFK
jgi:RIO-like serine/threonine protein kinase